MKEVLFNLGYYVFKLYVWNYFLFFRFFNVVAMQIKQWCSCDISITVNNQCEILYFWHNYTQLLIVPLLIYDNDWSTKKFPGVNPMRLGAPLVNTYLEPKQNEKCYLVFKNKYTTIYQNTSRDYPNGPSCPLRRLLSTPPTKVTIFSGVYKSKYPTKGKIWCYVIKKSPKIHQTLSNLRSFLEAN